MCVYLGPKYEVPKDALPLMTGKKRARTEKKPSQILVSAPSNSAAPPPFNPLPLPPPSGVSFFLMLLPVFLSFSRQRLNSTGFIIRSISMTMAALCSIMFCLNLNNTTLQIPTADSSHHGKNTTPSGPVLSCRLDENFITHLHHQRKQFH